MGNPPPSRHTAFLYASQAAYFANLVEFFDSGARKGERLLVITTRARWRDIVAKLDSAATTSLEARGGGLIVADAETILDETVRKGIFKRARFDAEFSNLLGNGHPVQHVYSEAAAILVSRDNLPAALAFEHAEQEVADHSSVRISCGFDLQQFPEAEHDWQVRAVINAHQGTSIEPDTWTSSVPVDAARPVAREAPLILLWDDYPDTRIMYADALTFGGYRVITAADAPQAFTLAKAYRPDVLVLDVRLPAKLAVATMRRLKARPGFNAPILALTAHAFQTERVDILEHGFDVVLSKPCLPDALVAAVTKALEGRRND
jgi:CheY-like chemotaxis protein